jgi:hypothetical protein
LPEVGFANAEGCAAAPGDGRPGVLSSSGSSQYESLSTTRSSRKVQMSQPRISIRSPAIVVPVSSPQRLEGEG